MTGFPIARAVSKPAGVDRVVVGSTDITWFRAEAPGDTPIEVPGYTLIEPFAYGASQPLVIKRTNSYFEPYGTGDLAWLVENAKVKYQRVTDDGTVTDYRGFIRSIRNGDASVGFAWVAEVAGELTGKASDLDRPQQIIRKRFDIGNKVTFMMEGMGFHLAERFPETSVDFVESGGTTQLALLQTLCALTRTEESQQWTIMPTVWGGSTWAFAEKDVTTKDFTVFADGSRIVLDLVNDTSEKPNTVFGNGVSRSGERWRNARYPGFFQGTPAGYPFADHSHNFGIGTTDADTDTGFGISVLVHKLTYLDDGLANLTTYTSAVARAVKRLQAAAGQSQTGTMTYDAWQALWNTDAVGFDTDGARIFPLYQHPSVNRYRYSASGDLVGRNPDYVEGTRRVDRSIDFGLCERDVAARYARNLVNSLSGNQWTGTITLNACSVFSGERTSSYANSVNADPQAFVDDMMVARDIRPGMNAWLPLVAGGTLVHISGVDVDDNGATLTVDTQARNLLEVSQIIARRKESKRDLRREWMVSNMGTRPAGNMISRDRWFGRLTQKKALPGNTWTTFPLVVGQSGTVNFTRLEMVQDVEFVVCVFVKKVTRKQLNNQIGNPFPVSEDGESVWDQASTAAFRASKILRYAAGDETNPCGYGARNKFRPDGETRTAAPLNGLHLDDGTWSYLCEGDQDPVVWMGIYPLEDCTLKAGRLLWALEDDVT